ncbi:hypothetical protein GQX73_g4092 [Xylaria multiplex]|uniref:Uncharacterized protein n=1 Tax=Xylaria multiplex TaxID=323545 RepID=A0A7C8ITG1_9PEZI|nr:hypothetical protein GQX73_g4092 [Xylaria multiplex]
MPNPALYLDERGIRNHFNTDSRGHRSISVYRRSLCQHSMRREAPSGSVREGRKPQAGRLRRASGCANGGDENGVSAARVIRDGTGLPQIRARADDPQDQEKASNRPDDDPRDGAAAEVTARRTPVAVARDDRGGLLPACKDSRDGLWHGLRRLDNFGRNGNSWRHWSKWQCGYDDVGACARAGFWYGPGTALSAAARADWLIAVNPRVGVDDVMTSGRSGRNATVVKQSATRLVFNVYDVLGKYGRSN